MKRNILIFEEFNSIDYERKLENLGFTITRNKFENKILYIELKEDDLIFKKLPMKFIDWVVQYGIESTGEINRKICYGNSIEKITIHRAERDMNYTITDMLRMIYESIPDLIRDLHIRGIKMKEISDDPLIRRAYIDIEVSDQIDKIW